MSIINDTTENQCDTIVKMLFFWLWDKIGGGTTELQEGKEDLYIISKK